MKIQISPFALLRVPQFSYHAQLEQCWESLKTAIAEASPAFHEIIASMSADDLKQATPKTQYTVWKYFNRARYRAVPYGKFAGIALADLAHLPELKKLLRISEGASFYSAPDWSVKPVLDKSDAVLFSAERLFLANSSTYALGNQLRYLNRCEDHFELAEIEPEQMIISLLQSCTLPICYRDLQKLFSGSLDTKNLNSLLRGLQDLGLLFTDLDRNIIGKDFYERLGLQVRADEQVYSLTGHHVLEGNIDGSLLKSFPAYLELLLKIVPRAENEAMTQFKKAFKIKYKKQEVQLLQVLDPETGIGYHQLEGSTASDDLIEQLVATARQPLQQKAPDYDQRLRAFLLNAICDTKGDKAAVIDIGNFIPQQAASRPGNTFSALVHIADDLVIPDYIGGCTANGLSGRFTLASPEILRHCKASARHEADSNPDIVFFDMGYMAEGHVDNVNRRASIYQHELLLFGYSLSDTLIAINDLYIVMQGDELIIYAKKLQKRVMPRLSSAYNYSRSDLSLFRLLCDLQHQGIQGNLNFKIQDILPGLHFYPRIQFDQIVVSPAQWRIDVSKPITIQLEENAVCRHFTAGSRDQTLCFDRYNAADMQAFAQFAAQSTDFYIQEAFIAESAAIIDKKNEPYQSQLLLTLSHADTLYTPYQPIVRTKKLHKTMRIIPPGQEWLYFEIYCHPSRSDGLLNKQISDFLNAYKKAFSCFFFIRYNHPQDHLRIRIKLNDPRQGYFYIAQFMSLLEDEMRAGTISDVQIKPYIRELERYGDDLIAEIEHHFELSSSHVLDVIRADYDTQQRYVRCARLATALLNRIMLSPQQEQTVLKEIQDAFIAEHGLSTAELKLINKNYAAYLLHYATMDPAMTIDMQLMQTSFGKLLDLCDESRAIRLFADLMHMHINRMFTEHQRTHELIIYSFLLKDLMRRKHTEKH